MKVYFSLPEFDAQLLRTLSYVYTQGADLGECLVTAARIKEGDIDSWYQEWMALATHVEQEGETAEQQGHPTSAKKAFLKASNYYRTAYFFLMHQPVDPRLVEAYDKHVACFQKASSHFQKPPEPVQIPYDGGFLPGDFYRNSSKKRPVLITHTGYDGTRQELYLTVAEEALERGYHVLVFDGPGHGELLIKQGVMMRPDWENVVTPAVNWLLKRKEVDREKLILFGESWGGMLTPRAAASEPRLAALVASPGQWDALEGIERFIPDVRQLLDNNDSTTINTHFAQAMTSKMLALKLRSKMWVHGAASPYELLKIWQEFHLDTVAPKIQCPTLITDSENEPLSSGQAKKLFDALNCPKEYLFFPCSDGAGEHCEAGARSLFYNRVFDWLDNQIAATVTSEV